MKANKDHKRINWDSTLIGLLATVLSLPNAPK
jgi:hypothetical protein